jgi:hypothetical protein
MSINREDMHNLAYEAIIAKLVQAEEGGWFSMTVGAEIVHHPYTRCNETGTLICDPHYLVDRAESRLRSLGCVNERGSLVPVTTRPRGEHEVDGRDYIFVSHRLYKALRTENWIGSEAYCNGHCYGELATAFTIDPHEYTVDDPSLQIDVKLATPFHTIYRGDGTHRVLNNAQVRVRIDLKVSRTMRVKRGGESEPAQEDLDGMGVRCLYPYCTGSTLCLVLLLL